MITASAPTNIKQPNLQTIIGSSSSTSSTSSSSSSLSSHSYLSDQSPPDSQSSAQPANSCQNNCHHSISNFHCPRSNNSSSHLTPREKLRHSALIIFDSTTPDHRYRAHRHLIRKSLSTPSFSSLQHPQKRLSSLVSHSPEHQSSLSVQLANHSSAVMDSRTSLEPTTTESNLIKLKPINDSNNLQNQRLRVNGRRPLRDNRRSGKSLMEDVDQEHCISLNEDRTRPPRRNDSLEDYPQEELLKILARLLDRITDVNNHLKRTGRAATPSSELCCPRRIRRVKIRSNSLVTPQKSSPTSTSASSKSTTTITSSPTDAHLKRPCRSPTVTQFQQTRQLSILGSPPTHPTNHQDRSPSDHNSKTDCSNQLRLKTVCLEKQQGLTTASIELLKNPCSILSFHAKLVPQISIEAYLMRILKYCPTTNQVFLSAIVYLDRLSSRIRLKGHASANTDGKRHRHGFVVDSWNVHRYLIACLTASSKFLSDVFYTNSRYAKVGGLPLEELNELEVKFLLMNDFRMMIKLEEMVWYEERLITDRAIWDSENSTANSSKSDEEDFSEDYDDEEGEDYYEEDQDDGVNVRNTRDECCSSTSSNSERSSCSTVTPFCNTPTGSSSTILK